MLTQSAFGLAFSTFVLLPKFLATELSARPSQIGGVTSIFATATMLFTPIVGVWVDRTSRRPFVLLGTLLMAAGAAGFLWVDQMGPAVYALRFLQGLAFALVFVAAGSLVTDQSPPERMSQAIGLFGVSMLTMNAVGPALAEEIVARSGWKPVFALATAASLLAFVMTSFWREHRAPPQADEHVPGLWEVITQKRVIWFLSISALAGAAFGAMFTFSQPFALELGMKNVRGFFVAYAAAAIVVRVFLGQLSDRAGRGRVSVVSMALYALAVLWMADLRPGLLEWVGAVFGIAHGLFYPAFNALALEGAGAHGRGKIIAIFNGAFNGGWAVSGILFGLLAERSGYAMVFVYASLCAFMALGLLISAREIRKAR